MRASTEVIVRSNARPTQAGDAQQNEVDLGDQRAFVWVYLVSRIAAGGSPSINSLNFQLTYNEETSVAEQIRFGNQDGFVTTTTDGNTITKPPLTDIANVGDTVLRVVYGETARMKIDADNPRYIQTNSRTLGTEIAKASCCLLFPYEYLQNMNYIGRARTDTHVANDDESPYSQPFDERLKPEVCVLRPDGTYYAESAT